MYRKALHIQYKKLIDINTTYASQCKRRKVASLIILRAHHNPSLSWLPKIKRSQIHETLSLIMELACSK